MRNPVMGRKDFAAVSGPCALCGELIRKRSGVCELHFPIRSGLLDPARPWGTRTHWRCYLDFLREYPCAYCGTWKDGRMQVDHVLPRSRGGSNDPDNLAPCCADCNASKGQCTPEEWMGPG